MKDRSIVRATALGTATVCAALALTGSAYAAEIKVNTTDDYTGDDNAKCSLREATKAANNDRSIGGCAKGSGADVIRVPEGTYCLRTFYAGPCGESADAGRASDRVEAQCCPGPPTDDDSERGDLDITERATIAGAGARKTIINAELNSDRALDIVSNEGDDEPNAGPSVVYGVTLTGGAAYNYDSNYPVYIRSGDGGANLRAQDDLILRDSTVSHGSSDAREGGGGALFRGATARILRTTFSSNVAGYYGKAETSGGGAILNAARQLTIDSSTFSGNSTDGNGGAIADHGGAIALTDSTIVNNEAHGVGGGFHGISALAGTGDEAAADTAKNTIVANNRIVRGDSSASGTSTARGQNCAAGSLFSSLGHNLENRNECGFGRPSDQPDTPAGVRPLADNGGPTNTHALSAASAAVDGGASAVATDQRRAARPVDGDGDGSKADDIGAFERAAGSVSAGG